MDDIIVIEQLIGPQITLYKRKTAKIIQAEALLKKLMRNLKSKLYHYIYALDVFEFVAVKEKIALSTDGIHIYYNPSKVIQDYRKNSKDLELQIAHMMVHGLLGHFEKLSQFEHKRLAGIIMDAQVEKLLVKMGLRKKSEDSYFVRTDKAIEMYFEGYAPYYEATKNKRLRKYWMRCGLEFERDDHSFWLRDLVQLYIKCQEQEGAQDDGDSEGQGSMNLSQMLKGVWEKARTVTFGVSAISLVENSIDSLADKTVSKAGIGAGSCDQIAEPVKEGNSYEEILREFLKERERCIEDVNDIDRMLYSYGLELYGDVALVEPSEVSEVLTLNNLFVAIDTSGSCSGTVASRFVRETYNIFRDAKQNIQFENIYIIQCDYAIQKEEHYTNLDDLQDVEEELKKLRGFGGTSFVPVFERIEERMKSEELEVDALIYLTDSYGDFPDEKPEYPVFFAIPKEDFLDNGEPANGNIPDWITCVKLN